MLIKSEKVFFYLTIELLIFFQSYDFYFNGISMLQQNISECKVFYESLI